MTLFLNVFKRKTEGFFTEIGNKMIYFDAHCHMQPLKRFDKAKELGVTLFIVNATHPDDWESVCRLAQERDDVLPCLGVHPWYVESLPADWLNRLSRYLEENPTVMVGEIGLDGTKGRLPYQAQIFENCLRLARFYKRPAHIHGHKAWSNIVDILACYSEVPCLFHRYGGGQSHTRRLLQYNTYFSFIRPKPYENIPADRVLIESDSPDGLHRPEGVVELAANAGLSWEQLNQNLKRFLSPLAGIDQFL